jgi:hypothetical protein
MLRLTRIAFPRLFLDKFRIRVAQYQCRYNDREWHLALELAEIEDRARWVREQNDRICPDPVYASYRFDLFERMPMRRDGTQKPQMEMCAPNERAWQIKERPIPPSHKLSKQSSWSRGRTLERGTLETLATHQHGKKRFAG